jgi:hypothetical protein
MPSPLFEIHALIMAFASLMASKNRTSAGEVDSFRDAYLHLGMVDQGFQSEVVRVGVQGSSLRSTILETSNRVEARMGDAGITGSFKRILATLERPTRSLSPVFDLWLETGLTSNGIPCLGIGPMVEREGKLATSHCFFSVPVEGWRAVLVHAPEEGQLDVMCASMVLNTTSFERVREEVVNRLMGKQSELVKTGTLRN